MNRHQDAYDRVSQSLPVLRGWAIVWIVAYHLMGNTRGYLVFDEAIAALSKGGVKNVVDSALALFITAGSTGVNVFLIISGFGLTASWWKKYGAQGIDKIPLITFWQRRILRIVPQFWAAIAIALMLYCLNPSWAPFGQSVWEAGGFSPFLAVFTTLTTLRNFVSEHYYFLNGAWWYVGLSIQLYLIFPLLIWFGCRYGWLRLLIVTLLFSLAYRAVFLLFPIGGDSNLIPLAFFPSRLFEFTVGIYVAIALLSPNAEPNKRIARWLENLLLKPQLIPVSCGLFLVGISFKWLPYSFLTIFAEALIGVGLFCGLVRLSQGKRTAFNQISQLVGKYSYGTYLTHMNVYLVLWPLATAWIPSYWLRFVLVTLACCVVGMTFEVGFSACSKALSTAKQKHKQLFVSRR